MQFLFFSFFFFGGRSSGLLRLEGNRLHGKRMVGAHRDVFADELLDVLEVVHLVGAAEADSLALLAGPAGAADAVDVGFGLVGQIKVHHQGQLVDVDAPGGDVGGHQYPDLSAFEVGQGRLAGPLALVAVDGGGGKAVPAEVFRHPVGPVFGAGEYQSAVGPQGLQQPGQQLPLVGFVHKADLLADGLHRGGRGRDLDEYRLVQHAGGQLLDGRGHGGAEQQSLPLGGQLGQHLFHVMDKAHVQHPVGLVQHKGLHGVQPQQALAHEVVEPPGGGHQDVGPFLQRLHLGRLTHAAEDDAAGQRQVAGVGGDAFPDLDGQFPGGGEDEHPQGLFGLAGQSLQKGKGESGCLAGAGLGTAQQIPPGQNRRNRLLLDGGRGGVSLFRNRLYQGLCEAKLRKIHNNIQSVCKNARKIAFHACMGKAGVIESECACWRRKRRL